MDSNSKRGEARATLVEILPRSGSKVEKLPSLRAGATSAIASSSPLDRILPGGPRYHGAYANSICEEKLPQMMQETQ